MRLLQEINMTVEDLEQRIKDMTKALEQSMANHNALVGRIEEAKTILESLQKAANVVEEVVNIIE
jgi:predicted  nucleic acid-binding Zn-ribbon protein